MLDGVLVVDDDQALRETLVSVLQFCGASQVWEAADLAQAREILACQPVRLLVCDLYLRHSQSVPTLHQWQAEGFLKVPVLLMSGDRTLLTATGAPTWGGFDALVKPFSLEAFRAACQTALAASAAS